MVSRTFAALALASLALWTGAAVAAERARATVEFAPTDTRLELEMHGEWAFRRDVSGPLRDRPIHKMHFGGSEDARSERKHYIKKLARCALRSADGDPYHCEG